MFAKLVKAQSIENFPIFIDYGQHFGIYGNPLLSAEQAVQAEPDLGMPYPPIPLRMLVVSCSEVLPQCWAM